MTRRNIAPGPGQMMLELEMPQEPAEVMQPIVEQPVQDEVGLSVSVLERNLALQSALALLGKASQRGGFANALETPHRRKIEERYGRSTPTVARGASRNENTYEITAELGVYKALGHDVLRAAKVKSTIDHDAREFMQQYSGPTNRQRRDAFKKQLIRAHRIMTK